MATLINYKNCEEGSLKGTGVQGCKVDTAIPNGFILVPKTWELDSLTETFDNDYIKDKIQKREFHPLLNAFDFTDNSEETVFQTSGNTGIKSAVRKGKVEFDFMYQNGLCWSNAISTFDSFQRYDVILSWDNGVFGFAQKSDGVTLTGLDLGLLDVSSFKNANGSEKGTTSIKIQLVNSDQYNKNMVLLELSENGVDYSDINGILDAKMTASTVVDTDATINVSVVDYCNNGIQVLGLSVSDFKITGKIIGASTYNETTKQYELTGISPAFSTGETFKVSLGGVTYDSVDLAGVLYAGSTKEQTVA